MQGPIGNISIKRPAYEMFMLLEKHERKTNPAASRAASDISERRISPNRDERQHIGALAKSTGKGCTVPGVQIVIAFAHGR